MATVTYVGTGAKKLNPRTGKYISLEQASLVHGPPTTKRIYQITKGVPFKVTDLDDLKHFVDCARSSAWKVQLGKREIQKLKGFLEKLDLEPTRSGTLKKKEVKEATGECQ